MYDVRKGQGWRPLPAMARKRRHHACAVYGGRLVVAGGSGVFETVQSSVEVMDLSQVQEGWKEMAKGLSRQNIFFFSWALPHVYCASLMAVMVRDT